VVLLLQLLLLLHSGAIACAAVTFGLAVHLRIYPIIYAPAIVLFLAARAACLMHGVADTKALPARVSSCTLVLM